MREVCQFLYLIRDKMRLRLFDIVDIIFVAKIAMSINGIRIKMWLLIKEDMSIYI